METVERTRMHRVTLPDGLVEGRTTPWFTSDTVPSRLMNDHSTTCWAALRVAAGTVHFTESEGDSPRSLIVSAGGELVIVPNVKHSVSFSDDAEFAITMYVTPDNDNSLDQPAFADD